MERGAARVELPRRLLPRLDDWAATCEAHPLRNISMTMTMPRTIHLVSMFNSPLNSNPHWPVRKPSIHALVASNRSFDLQWKSYVGTQPCDFSSATRCVLLASTRKVFRLCVCRRASAPWSREMDSLVAADIAIQKTVGPAPGEESANGSSRWNSASEPPRLMGTEAAAAGIFIALVSARHARQLEFTAYSARRSAAVS